MLSWPNGSLPGFGTKSYDYWVRTKKRFVFSTREIFLTSKAPFSASQAFKFVTNEKLNLLGKNDLFVYRDKREK